VAVNIDNGYGGACAAIRWVNMLEGTEAFGQPLRR
jgi:NCAIR mutase (PurE)-related protein